MVWPNIRRQLLSTSAQAAPDFESVLEKGTSWMIKQMMAGHLTPLPPKMAVPGFRPSETVAQTPADNSICSSFHAELAQKLSDAYFDTFNILYPVLDQNSFQTEVLDRLAREGYADRDPVTVLALTVFALGIVAIEGVFASPIDSQHDAASGFRGGSTQSPPGIDVFNEARHQTGFLMTLCTLENVQILLLQATYWEAAARHLDYWRCTVAASMACQVIVRTGDVDWLSHEGDMVKRAYWTCVIFEDLYHLELDLPETGICNLEDEVPLPQFHEALSVQEKPSSDIRYPSHFGYHFLAIISLRRLMTRIRMTIYEGECDLSAIVYTPSKSDPSNSFLSTPGVDGRILQSARCVSPRDGAAARRVAVGLATPASMARK